MFNIYITDDVFEKRTSEELLAERNSVRKQGSQTGIGSYLRRVLWATSWGNCRIEMGILIIISLQLPNLVWGKFTGRLSTRSSETPSIETVRFVLQQEL